MCIKIGPEFQCLEGKDKNSNVYRNRARIPMFGRIRSKTNVYTNRTNIPVFRKLR